LQAAPTTAQPSAAAAESTTEGIYLGRQPILDRTGELVAYELLFRSGTANHAAFTDATEATATVLNHVMNEFGLESVLGRHRGFVNLDAGMIMSDMIELLPKTKVVLEVLETVEITPAVIERCERLARLGFTLALDDVASVPPEYMELMHHIAIVKVDLKQLDDAGLERLVKTLRVWPAKLLAEKVDDRAQFERCLALGFELFQGYFFAKPEILRGKRLSPSETALLRLLGLVLSDAETPEIERVLKHEPMLTVNLLRLTNSVASGVRTRITSLNGALIALGRRQLQRWLQLLLYSSGGHGATPTPLMLLAATRGKVMEIIAREWHDRELEDRAFMTGIMSLIDALLALPLAELLAPLPVAPEVKEAVLERKGRLGALLDLAEAMEGRDTERVRVCIEAIPGLDATRVMAAQAEALRWVNDIGTQS